MANLTFDLSLNTLFKREHGVRTYKFKDIGTSKFKLINDFNNYSNNIKLLDNDTSLTDMDAIMNSLHNLFKFRTGQEILEPLYR